MKISISEPTPLSEYDDYESITIFPEDSEHYIDVENVDFDKAVVIEIEHDFVDGLINFNDYLEFPLDGVISTFKTRIGNKICYRLIIEKNKQKNTKLKLLNVLKKKNNSLNRWKMFILNSTFNTNDFKNYNTLIKSCLMKTSPPIHTMVEI
jgi:hypothetical protein